MAGREYLVRVNPEGTSFKQLATSREDLGVEKRTWTLEQNRAFLAGLTNPLEISTSVYNGVDGYSLMWRRQAADKLHTHALFFTQTGDVTDKNEVALTAGERPLVLGAFGYSPTDFDSPSQEITDNMNGETVEKIQDRRLAVAFATRSLEVVYPELKDRDLVIYI